jgi:cysteinyl-tRNA synthetase
MLKLYNSATHAVGEFRSLQPDAVGFYACGPTVYQRAHIGNLRTYVMEDILRRVLESEGYRVRHVVNITDVGHLTDDADAGQDKMEKASRATRESAWDIAKRYTEFFVQDLDRLDILKPHAMPRATDHIAQQIELIRRLEERGYTYRISDGIYFDTARFKTYGSLSGQALEEKEEGARVAVHPEKRHPTDFALWKFSPEGEKRQMEWESPWGIGFPGWHIECSAMSRKELGQPFDIHAGGIDHIPVHHENEIAQSEAAYDTPLAVYWFHVDFLLVESQKMSKSLGNVYTLDDVIAKGFDPLSYRYFLLGAHYRQKQNFTWSALQAAQNALVKLQNIVRDWQEPTIVDEETMKVFLAACEDDLNIAQALAVMWGVVESDLASGVKSATLLAMDRVLGLRIDRWVAHPLQVPSAIQKIMDERARARLEKDWKKSDGLRDELAEMGWMIEDTEEGQRLISKSISSS